ncbi:MULTISPECIES: DUF2157 domain-containing protein [unclassified Novosphingobium]|uniref:DUF2157 domain-containing protein n=1 Tax=unclassified Novosphingobium TaxID=2644732 RepID=UPI00086BBDAB|nr:MULTISPECIES: DUF2157 domain-containing protein [unclassified Novosphingobium]MBN9143282.1 DUF2157 domain-containing protein [Novosphingobium sp.]MDR6706371.1 hypothetical protein [Novosphingobium sp. 1748]ODU82635.1 MAG: hypothetical protein ABT10_09425 [Novosphingobium sp. SCN 63-17]OJX89595.1 MAG: hypothetical protein BGP00_15500 [Novosphingobium sp. 63-713]
MAERKLKAWVAAGLIDAAAADRIRAWEAQHSRPVALWAVVGLAALSIGLGIISLVAANWAAIPGETRLALHAALMVGLAAALWALLAQGGDTARRWAEVGIFVFAALGLGFIGHLGQVYQTSSPTWVAIGLWLALFAPLLLGGGQGWLSAALLAGGCIALPWMRFGDPALGFSGGQAGPGVIRGAIECALPVALTPLSALMLGGSARGGFWLRLGEIGFAYAIIAVSLFVIASGFGDWGHGHWAGDPQGNVDTALVAVAGVLGLAGLALWQSDRTVQGAAGAAVFAMLALAMLAADRLSGHGLAMGLLFMVLWAGLAGAALHARARWAFQMAVAVVALRLIILAFEEAGGLLASGVGLILGGMLVLGVAWGALRISRRFAPARGIA